MRLPRDVSGKNLAQRLARFGYRITRQAGSHIRLTTDTGGQHHVTIPDHSALRVGTLSGILGDVAHHLGKPKEELAEQIFEK